MRSISFYIGYGISILGSGLIYPLVVLFLTEVVGITPALASIYFAVVGGTSLIAGVVASLLVSRLGPAMLSMFGILLQTISSFVIACSSEYYTALLAGFLLGCGNGVFFAMQTVLFLMLFGKASLSRIFAGQLVIMNIAVAIGGVSGGLLVQRLNELGYRIAFLLNGCSYVIYGIVLLVLYISKGQHNNAIQNEDNDSKRSFGSIRKMIMLTAQFSIVQLVIDGGALAPVDTVLPLKITSEPEFDVLTVSLFLTVNGAAVVFMQKLGLRLHDKLGGLRSLMLSSTFWTATFVVCLLAFNSSVNGAIKLGLLFLAAVLFAVGEVLYAPSFQPLIVDSVPEPYLAKVTGFVSTFYSLGLLIGPLISLPILNVWSGTFVWILLILVQALCLSVLFVYRSRLAGSKRGSFFLET